MIAVPRSRCLTMSEWWSNSAACLMTSGWHKCASCAPDFPTNWPCGLASDADFERARPRLQSGEAGFQTRFILQRSGFSPGENGTSCQKDAVRFSDLIAMAQFFELFDAAPPGLKPSICTRSDSAG